MKLIIFGIVAILFFSLGCVDDGALFEEQRENNNLNNSVIEPVCGNGVIESGETKLTCCEDVGCGEYEECEEGSCVSMIKVTKEQAIAQAKQDLSFALVDTDFTGYKINRAVLIEKEDDLYWEIELYPYMEGNELSELFALMIVVEMKATEDLETSVNEGLSEIDEELVSNDNYKVTGCTGIPSFNCSQCIVNAGEEVVAHERYSCDKITECAKNCKISTWAVCDMGSPGCCMPTKHCDEIENKDDCLSRGCVYVE